MLDKELLTHRLTAMAVRIASLEGEIASMGQVATASWSGPAAERFNAELNRQRAALADIRSDLHNAAALVLAR